MPSAAKPRLLALLIVACAATSLAGCADVYHARRDTISFHAGDAGASNRAAQVIDPWPASAADRNIQHDGQRMQRAVERYRTNRTTPLSTTNTSSAPYAPAAASGGGGGAPATTN